MAAGDGKRLKSTTPKVLHVASGKSLLVHVLSALAGVERASTIVVASPRVDEIKTAVAAHISDDITYVVQERPAGTADAARLALEVLPAGISTLLIVPGDTPLLSSDTLTSLVTAHAERGAALTLLTARVQDPSGYGRIVRGPGDRIEAIVEDRDANEHQRLLDEVNASVYVIELERLQAALPKVGAENAQTEYYLTDVVELLVAEGHEVFAVTAEAAEAHGVNSRADLARVEAAFRQRTCEHWMNAGVTIVDPATTYIDASVVIEGDAVIRPFTFLEGKTSIAAGAEVGPHVRIVDSTFASHASVS